MIDFGIPPGERIAAARRERALSQAELARAVGVTRQTLNQIERTSALPRVDTALGIAAALGRTVEELFAPPSRAGVTVLPVTVVGAMPPDGSRIHVGWLDGRWLATASDGAAKPGIGLSEADGILRRDGKGDRVETSEDPAGLTENLFVAGCDPALALLCEQVSRAASRGRCVWVPCGSGTALERLARGEVHLAGIHFGADDATNMAAVRRHGLEEGCMVVRFSRWDQGWMVRPEVDARFRGAGSFRPGGLRLVNREPGSVCRTELDALVRRAGLRRADVVGYDMVATSHAECAQRIARAEGDAGLGCESIALAYGLAFRPLTRVAFDLVIRRDLLAHPLLAALVKLLPTRRFARALAQIPGYDVAETGRILRD